MRGWRTALVVAACALALGGGCAKKKAAGPEWLTTMDEGKTRAAKDKKVLVVYYTADWSKLAEQFENDVLDNADVQKKLEKFVTVKIDADADEDTPKTYNVAAFPTTIFYTYQGEEVKRLVGTVKPQDFVKLLDDIAAGRVETTNQLLAREKANPGDLKLAYDIGSMYVETGRPEKARPRFEKILAEDPDNRSGFVPGALTQLGFMDLTGEQPEPAIEKFTAVVEKYPDAEQARKCQLYLGDAYQLLDDRDKAIAAYRDVIAKYPNTPEATEAQTKVSKLTMFEETVESFTGKPTAETK